MNVSIIGYIGCFLLSISLVPQVYTSWTTHNVNGISPLFIFITIGAKLCMITYGANLNAIPVVCANGFVLFYNIILLLMHYKYNEKENNIVENK